MNRKTLAWILAVLGGLTVGVAVLLPVTASANGGRYVTPQAACDHVGAKGKARNGGTYECRLKPGADCPRWSWVYNPATPKGSWTPRPGDPCNCAPSPQPSRSHSHSASSSAPVSSPSSSPAPSSSSSPPAPSGSTSSGPTPSSSTSTTRGPSESATVGGGPGPTATAPQGTTLHPGVGGELAKTGIPIEAIFAIGVGLFLAGLAFLVGAIRRHPTL